jgi:LacI family transcriptional regulator
MAEATIRDVARRAEVSIASVSRVLNGAAKVSEPTRSRIEEAVRELGYVPHAGARSLSMARTNALGVVLPDLHGEFFSEIVRGMDREASARGYLLLLSPLHGESERPATALRAMRGRVDGLLLMAPQIGEEALALALPSGLPSVLMNTRADMGNASIHLDNEAGARAVAEHFLALGRRHIVHIAGPEGNIDAQERAAAFMRALAGRGVEAKLLPGDFSEPSGVAAVERLLAEGEPFDAIFAANDNMAIGALGALRRAAIAVPEAVALAGFDDIPLARHLGLTTVRVRIAELGQRAVSLLIDLLQGVDVPQGRRDHQPELVVRATSDPAGTQA